MFAVNREECQNLIGSISFDNIEKVLYRRYGTVLKDVIRFSMHNDTENNCITIWFTVQLENGIASIELQYIISGSCIVLNKEVIDIRYVNSNE